MKCGHAPHNLPVIFAPNGLEYVNAESHRRIVVAAAEVLPQPHRTFVRADMDLLERVGNYPDMFDAPTRSDSEKDNLDADWRRFCRFPVAMAGPTMHAWPHPCTASRQIRPLLEHLMGGAVGALGNSDGATAVKFLGCISHYLGDCTQPAHLIQLSLLERMLPRPAGMESLHYHTDIETVTGRVGALRSPTLLGACLPEIAWRTASVIAHDFYHCQQYVVPLLQAIFSRNAAEAERVAGEPMTVAAQATADVWYSLLCLGRGRLETETSQLAGLAHVDLRNLPPSDSFVDLVYGAVIRDASRQDPPNGPLVPARLRFAGGEVRTVHGLGVLPHSGMTGPRECHLSYDLPEAVFQRLECQVGLNADIGGDGAVRFQVELDGRPVVTTDSMTIASPAEALSVPLGQAETLTLRVLDASDGRGFWHNHAIWGEPVLVRAPLADDNGKSR